MVSQETVLEALRTVNDPEMPINIVDLGIVDAVRIEPGADASGSRVVVEILPTFVGCPALPWIENDVRKRLGAMPGVTEIDVHFRFDPPWTVDRISPAGRESLREFGVTVPQRRDHCEPETQTPQCPFCGSSQVHLESSFGPTRCRMIYYCESCRNPFEHLKRIPVPVLFD
ncbi:MAG TPA: 1,2-phenylacetyl-CoA epoxidase subunit PaaD [Gemmataceae bacterium]|nr:1,2-phenylacetyl-CoA epoxidase subunit PaaD [Gemmataceae bacterium]